MPITLARVWTANHRSPESSVLGRSFQLVPGVTHLDDVSLEVMLPGVSWATSSPLSLRVSLQCLPADVD